MSAPPLLPAEPTHLDRRLPTWQEAERHAITLLAPPERVWEVLHTVDLGGGPVVKGLLALRALPAALFTRGGMARLRRNATAGIRLTSFTETGFTLLESSPPHEVLLGLQGRFWRPTGKLDRLTADGFRDPIPPGVARALWNFTLTPLPEGGTELATETRIAWSDPAAGRSFRRYWRLIRPFSGLIRMRMLKSVERGVRRG